MVSSQENNGILPDLKLPNVQRKMLNLLADGELHTPQELHTCCGPSEINVVKMHMMMLRRALEPTDLEILSKTRNRQHFYYLVRVTPIRTYPVKSIG